MEKTYDVIIVGAGIIGASMALLLADCGLHIAIIESQGNNNKQKPEHHRTLVLAHSSQVILNMMTIWSNVEHCATAIKKIHVSDRGHYGSSQIFAEQEGVPYLGYVLPAAKLEAELIAALIRNDRIDIYQPAKFLSFEYLKQEICVEAEQEGFTFYLTGKLLIAADGQHSSVRKFLKIKNSIHDYQQVAIICNVDLKRAHEGVAYERFTDQGPLAFLPLQEKQAAVVWTVPTDHAKKLLSMAKESFLSSLQSAFGYRLGKLVNCSQPLAVNLQRVVSTQQVFPRAVLLGNAVHTLHPVAGQGLNLALRDMAVLSEYILQSYKNGEDIGCINLLRKYLEQRKKDQQQITNLTHSLVGIFSNSLLPIVLARNLGVVMLDRVDWLKKILTKRTLGLAGKVPRLACGLSIDS